MFSVVGVAIVNRGDQYSKLTFFYLKMYLNIRTMLREYDQKRFFTGLSMQCITEHTVEVSNQIKCAQICINLPYMNHSTNIDAS